MASSTATVANFSRMGINTQGITVRANLKGEAHTFGVTGQCIRANSRKGFVLAEEFGVWMEKYTKENIRKTNGMDKVSISGHQITTIEVASRKICAMGSGRCIGQKIAIIKDNGTKGCSMEVDRYGSTVRLLNKGLTRRDFFKEILLRF